MIIEERFIESVQEVCNELDVVIVAMKYDTPCSLVFLHTLPIRSPAGTMVKSKGVISKKVREAFPHLQHLPSLWTRLCVE